MYMSNRIGQTICTHRQLAGMTQEELAKASGKLIPLIRIRDNTQLAPEAYRVLSYDKVLLEGNCERVDETAYCQMVDAVFSCGSDNYDHLINKQIVKILVDNLRENYPGIADDLIPGKVSYLQIERKLQQIVRAGGSIRDLIHIVEEMEEAASCL